MEKREEEAQAALEQLNNQNEAIQEKLLRQESVVIDFNNRIDHLKNNIHLQQLPNLEDIESTINKALEAYISHDTTYVKSLILPAPQEGMSGQAEASNTPDPTKAKTSKKKRSKSPTLDRIYKRTLLVSGVKNLLGREIQSILTRDRTCTASSVDRVMIKKKTI